MAPENWLGFIKSGWDLLNGWVLHIRPIVSESNEHMSIAAVSAKRH